MYKPLHYLGLVSDEAYEREAERRASAGPQDRRGMVLTAVVAASALAFAGATKAEPKLPTVAEAFVAGAFPATVVDDQLEGGGYMAGVSCYYNDAKHTHIDQLKAGKPVDVAISRAESYIVGEHVGRTVFQAGIEPDALDIFNVSMKTDGDAVTLHANSVFDDASFDRNTQVTLHDGQVYEASYRALRYAIAHTAGNYTVAIECDEPYMDAWNAQQDAISRETLQPPLWGFPQSTSIALGQ